MRRSDQISNRTIYGFSGKGQTFVRYHNRRVPKMDEIDKYF